MPPSDDPSAALVQLVVRLRAAPRADRTRIVNELVPLLANPRVPLAVRYAAAGRALDALPDKWGAVRGVVKALTARVPPARALHRLRHLQRLTERSAALDALVARRERKVKMRCPRCAVRLPRPDMAKHLWHEHGLMLAGGKASTPAQVAETIRREHATTGDPALIDRAAALDGERAVRAWAAETATEEETAPLCADARTRGVSLCPACFGEVLPAMKELPPPLVVAKGRLAGDGFVARAPVLAPPRTRATAVAAGTMIGFGLFVPVLLAFVLSAVAYGLTLVLLRPKSSPDDQAVDAAWRKLARRLIDRRDAGRFLARLCLTSLGRGDPFERANALNALVARARAHPGERRLLAVALALRMDDSGRFGRDRAAGVADLVAPVFQRKQSPRFADDVLGAYLRVPRGAGELARLRVLLLARAFAADLNPRDVLALCAAAPHVAAAMRLSPNHVALLYGVWTNRSREWKRVGRAKTVFELAAGSPRTAARLLTYDPGLALVRAARPGAEAQLGPVLVSLSGVSVGGMTTSDPAAEVRLGAHGRELVFGKQALRVRGGLPRELPAELKAWLRFRAEVLAGYPAAHLIGEAPLAGRLSAPFVVRCAACGTACLPVIGAKARPVPTRE